MLDEVIVPVYQIDDPAPADPSLTYSARFPMAQAISAGDFPRLRFRVPLGSGVIMVLTGVTVGAFKVGVPPGVEPVAVTSFLTDIGTGLADFSNILPSTPRDTRNSQAARVVVSTDPSGLAQSTITTTLGMAVLVTQLGFTELTSGPGNFPRQPPTVVKENHAFELLASGADVEGSTSAVTLVANVAWIEIPTGGLGTP